MSNTLAANPYWQITLTYLRRKLFWLSGAIFLFLLIPIFGGAFEKRQLRPL